MPDVAQVGYGTTLAYKIGAGGYTLLANLIDLDPPDITVKPAEYQPLNASRWKQRAAGTGTLGMLKFTCLHGAQLMSTLYGLLFNNTLTWQITLADTTTTETFLGVLTKIGRKYKADEYDVIDIEITPSDALAHSP